MKHYDIYVPEFDAATTFALALHHLMLAAAMFERFSPEEFEAERAKVKPERSIRGLLGQVGKEAALEQWISRHKDAAVDALIDFAEDDPAGDPLWKNFADELRGRLAAEGWDEEEIADEIGDMGNQILSYQRDRA